MLLMNTDHHCVSKSGESTGPKPDTNTLLCQQSKFLTTSRMLRLFSAGMKSPKTTDKVIYIDGAWDMFHCGHVKFLKAAKEVSCVYCNSFYLVLKEISQQACAT